MSELEVEKHWTKQAEAILVNRKIVKVEYLSQDECENTGWYSRPLVIFLDNGTHIVIQSDDEGNDGGAIYYDCTKGNPKSNSLGVLPTL